MRVVLDASAIIGSSFYATSPTFRSLFASVDRLHIQLILLEIVVDEVVNHAAEEFEQKRKRANDAMAAYGRATDFVTQTIDDDQHRALVDQFRQRILMEFERHGAEIKPFAAVDHRELVTRDISKKKPFGGMKSSYRDALIWFSVLELLEEQDDPLILVTANVNDFAAANELDPDLHPDLLSDLRARNLTAEHVILVRNLDEFVNRFVVQNTEEDDRISQLVREGPYQGLNLRADLAGIIDYFLGDLTSGVEPHVFGFGAEVWSVWYLGDDDTLVIDDVTVNRIDTALLLIRTNVSLTAQFDAEVDARSDFAHGEETAVYDFDEMRASFGVEAAMQTTVQLTYNTDSQEVTSSAVLRLAVDDGEIEYSGGSSEDLANGIRNSRWYMVR